MKLHSVKFSLTWLLTAMGTFAMAIGLVDSARAQDLFPDKGLDAAVRAEVFAKRYNLDPLTIDDVKNISQVVGKGKAIKNLEGLQHCVAVMLVDLENNEISDIGPLKDLKQLQSVNLAGNRIESIQSLSELKGLQYLELSRNRITDTEPLRALVNMRSLYLSDNKIESIEPIVGLKKIWTLHAAKNPIRDFTAIGKLRWLSSLDLRGCHVRDASFLKPLSELKVVMLADNDLTDLTPIVEMVTADAKGEQRFAPFLELYLSGNPLSDKTKSEALLKIKEAGVRLKMDAAGK